MSSDQLLKAAEDMSPPELEHFVGKVITLQAQRKAPSLPPREAQLLMRVNQGIPLAIQQRSQELTAKRQAETLTAEEHNELVQSTEQIERLELQRNEALAELATLRGMTLRELMRTLGLAAPEHA